MRSTLLICFALLLYFSTSSFAWACQIALMDSSQPYSEKVAAIDKIFIGRITDITAEHVEFYVITSRDKTLNNTNLIIPRKTYSMCGLPTALSFRKGDTWIYVDDKPFGLSLEINAYVGPESSVDIESIIQRVSDGLITGNAPPTTIRANVFNTGVYSLTQSCPDGGYPQAKICSPSIKKVQRANYIMLNLKLAHVTITSSALMKTMRRYIQPELFL